MRVFIIGLSIVSFLFVATGCGSDGGSSSGTLTVSGAGE